MVKYVSNLVITSNDVKRKEIRTVTNFCWLLSQLNNLELAVSLAKRGNLPGAEKLVGQFLIKI